MSKTRRKITFEPCDTKHLIERGMLGLKFSGKETEDANEAIAYARKRGYPHLLKRKYGQNKEVYCKQSVVVKADFINVPEVKFSWN
jgi:hypothetical protein